MRPYDKFLQWGHWATGYIYNYGQYQNNTPQQQSVTASALLNAGSGTGVSGGIGICAWCHDAFSGDNPSVAIVSVSVPATSICTGCWKMVEEYATSTAGSMESKNAEIGNLKNLLTFAARYVQVCNEGGDWDIIDPRADISLTTLNRIRRALGLHDAHDFTKR